MKSKMRDTLTPSRGSKYPAYAVGEGSWRGGARLPRIGLGRIGQGLGSWVYLAPKYGR